MSVSLPRAPVSVLLLVSAACAASTAACTPFRGVEDPAPVQGVAPTEPAESAAPVVHACDGSVARARADCNGRSEDGCEVDPSSDPSHCGSCSTVCEAGEVCSQGVCSSGCATGLSLCERSCVDVQRNADHCGACGQRCPAGQVCELGTCKPCVPRCERRACGADDGCGQKCHGTCADGLRCVAGACICDASSCTGCCHDDQCLEGTAEDACGSGGAACAACTDTTTCEDGSCARRQTVCQSAQSALGTSCNDVCQQKLGPAGKCARKCGSDTGGVGIAYVAPACAKGKADATRTLGRCNDAVLLRPGESVECCCRQ